MTTRSREHAWIEWIQKTQGPLPSARFPVGIGDDAALWRPQARKDLVLTVDTQVEGTHFRRHWLGPGDIGWRAVSASVSDLAAMAASPGCLLIAIHADESLRDGEFRKLYRGILDASKNYSIPVAGGNISRGRLSVTVTALGEVDRGIPLCRSGLRPDDEIWVTGAPGLAHIGLLLLDDKLALPRGSRLARRALDAFRRPTARVEEASFLRRHWPLSGMIDLSDGLRKDLRHLLDATTKRSGKPLGIEVHEEAFYRIAELREVAARADLSPVDSALIGGDDYELCFAARPRKTSSRAARVFGKRHSLTLTRIGRVVRTPGLRLLRRDRSTTVVDVSGFEHF